MSSFRIADVEAWTWPVHTRIPFHFGIAELHGMPHLFLQVSLDCDGTIVKGIAAEQLLPKWFTKNPATSYEHDIQELKEVVATACRIARETPRQPTPFALWWEIYQEQDRQGKLKGWPPLLSSLGASLIERAIIDAFCHWEKKPFKTVLRENGLGVDMGMIYPELKGRSPREFLPNAPVTSIIARHTVGLTDPLTDDDLKKGKWPEDGLPVSLEACIRRYGLMSFKIKISADTDKNIARLHTVAALLDKNVPGGYTYTLDGNESYRSIDDFGKFWEVLLSDPVLTPWLGKMLFVEQPLHRDVALGSGLRQKLESFSRPPRMVLDESDACLDSLSVALDCGYKGTTHKNCKGVFKSVANLALLKSRFPGPGQYLFSGEDLVNIGPIGLLQDLCVAQNLGIDNIERNGHHYFRGLSAFPPSAWRPLLAAHADLYETLADGCPIVKIEKGRMKCDSLHHVGLGNAFDLDYENFTPLAELSTAK